MNQYKFKYTGVSFQDLQNGQIVGATARSEDQARNRLNACFNNSARLRGKEVIEPSMTLISIAAASRAAYFRMNRIEIKIAYAKRRRELYLEKRKLKKEQNEKAIN